MYRIDSPLIFTTHTYTMDEAIALVKAAGLQAGEFTITRV
jgi:hypothetical protein